MVTLDQIREEIKSRLSIDKELHFVNVHADTIEEALNDASVQLDTKVANLEYEVIERGSSGILGIGKKPWKLKIYQSAESLAQKLREKDKEMFGENGMGNDEVFVNKDGMFYVHRFASSIKLKVTLPIGNGSPVDVQEIIQAVKMLEVEKYDEELILKYAKQGTNGEYETIGSYKHVSMADASVSVEVSKDEMHAYITVSAPGQNGSEATFDLIKRSLKAEGILYGINEEKISEFVDNPVYSTPFEVASGSEPENGHDSYVDYKFETDISKIKAQTSEDGNMDFKELNKIQNVVTGQTLAVYVPATRGKPGKTLFGHILECRDGRNNPITLGKNVEYASDKVTILASINGQVLLDNDKITVEPLLQLDAVNIKTGNITFLGTVIVKGNVEDGFSVKASGGIDIGGTVGKSVIDAGGDIVIHQGVFGKDEGYIKAGKSLWGKFIQSAKIEVEENVIATDSLMNCDVTAMKNIVLYGKKAQITGGTYFATEEICARTIGSAGGSDTTLSVGIDPRAKKRLDELQEMQADLMKELENVELDITTLENQKKIRKCLSQEKEENLSKLIERKDKICSDSKEASKEIESLQQHLRDLKAAGKVKVEGTIYAGTKVYVRDALEEVTTDVKSLTFYYEGGFLKRGKYEPPSSAIKKGPEGYTN